MVCIYCGNETQVSNSRPQKRQNTIWRRRRCTGCEAVITTIEAPDLSLALVVSKAAGPEPFLSDKLFLSIHDSLRHRPSAITDARALTNTIIAVLVHTTEHGATTREEIITTTTKTLHNFDTVAATHYTAFHKP